MKPERDRMVRPCNEEGVLVTVQAPEAGMVVAIVAFLFILTSPATLMRLSPDRGGHEPHH